MLLEAGNDAGRDGDVIGETSARQSQYDQRGAGDEAGDHALGAHMFTLERRSYDWPAPE